MKMVLIAYLIYYPTWGFILSKYWAWFAVPLGLDPLTWAQCVGVMLVAGIVKGKDFIQKKDLDNAHEDDWIITLAGYVLMTPLVLCIGWLYHHILF